MIGVSVIGVSLVRWLEVEAVVMGTGYRILKEELLWFTGFVCGFCYVCSFVCFVLTTLLTAATPADGAAAGVAIASGAHCIRASRYRDYATVRLFVGSPTREAELLLRLDAVEPDGFLTVSASKVVQSDTLECDGTACRDLIIVQLDGPNSKLHYAWSNLSVTASNGDTSFAAQLGLAGEMKLTLGYSYWLTSSHLCWAPAETVDEPTGEPVVVAGSSMFSSAFGPGACNASAQLFPLFASIETLWLGLKSDYLNEHDEVALRQRRDVVSQGLVCSEGNASLALQRTLYEGECAQTGICAASPTVSYKHLASHSRLFIHLPRNASALLSAAIAPAVMRLPVLLSASDATLVAILRLVLMTLVAAVAFIRSGQEKISPKNILLSAIHRAVSLKPKLSYHTRMEVALSGLIGVVAVGARFTAIVVLADNLIDDGLTTVVVAEVVGCAVSIAHFLARNFCIAVDYDCAAPLTKLGGPMSTIDVSQAILISLAETPLLGTRQSFASTGRMLAAMLVLVSSIKTLVFSTSACALLALTVRNEHDYKTKLNWFSTILVFGAFLWIAQTVSVAVAFSMVFVNPFVFTISRVHVGTVANIRSLVSVALVSVALPGMNRVVLDTVRATRA